MFELNQWNFFTDVTNGDYTITLTKLIQPGLAKLIIKSKYIIDGKEYRTKLPSSLYSFLSTSSDTLEEIEFEKGIDTSELKDGCRAFYHFFKLRIIKGLEYFDMSNVHDIHQMFEDCYKLESIDIENWDVGNVENLYRLFYNCQSLVVLDLSKWNTSKVKNMAGAFAECYKLHQLNLFNWNFTSCETANSMFNNCILLESITGIEDWDMDNVKTIDAMFYNCASIAKLDLSKWFTKSLTSLFCTFAFCSGLKELNVDGIRLDQVEGIQGAFMELNSIERLDLSKLNFRHVLTARYLFKGCINLTELILSSNKWIQKNCDQKFMFEDCNLDNLTFIMK